MRPVQPCCTSVSRPSPSGYAWYHSTECPVSPGTKIRNFATTAERRQEEHRRVIQRGEDSRASVPVRDRHRLKADEPHKLCILALIDGGEPCARCSWLMDVDNSGSAYVAAHLDDAVRR